jgi:hypothetical protein
LTGVLIHDGRRSGHHGWATAAVGLSAADGVFINPFSTPRFSMPRHTKASDFAAEVRGAQGEVVFDAMTHARLLAGSNRTDLYDTWELWGGTDGDLSNALRRQQHVERVFERQSEIGVPLLTPTVNVEIPGSPSAQLALELAEAGAGIDASAWQSLAGPRTFWKSGTLLDDHIGRLVALRSPVWVLTITNEMVLENLPDLSDHVAFEGVLRSIHSLSQRSRVIVSFSDYAGLPAVAAGADTVGGGWDRGMRFFDPASFHIDSDPGIRIPASYVTQQNLSAVLRRDAAIAIEAWNSSEALRIRGGVMPAGDPAERIHHLRTLRELVAGFAAIADKPLRIAAVRLHYENAISDFDRLIADIGPAVREADRTAWTTHHLASLQAYASAEGLW